MILSIVTTVGVYLFIPHPEVIEVTPNPCFYDEYGALHSNTTVVVKNNGASGWVKITAVYQLDIGSDHDLWEKTCTMYIPAGMKGWVQFTSYIGGYVDNDYLWSHCFITARAEFAWDFSV